MLFPAETGTNSSVTKCAKTSWHLRCEAFVPFTTSSRTGALGPAGSAAETVSAAMLNMAASANETQRDNIFPKINAGISISRPQLFLPVTYHALLGMKPHSGRMEVFGAKGVRPCKISLARSAMATIAAFTGPVVMLGMIDASTT